MTLLSKAFRPAFYGEYNLYGYVVYGPDGEEYVAGNHMLDSGQFIHPHSPNALKLCVIANFCSKTGREIAKERGGRWVGRTRIDDTPVSFG